MKAALRGKLIALSASKKNLEKAYTSSTPESSRTTKKKKTKQTKKKKTKKKVNTPKKIRLQEIIKLRTEIIHVETKRIIQRINQTRSWFWGKINKIDKCLARLTTGHRDSTQQNQK
jgi:hypothetical protein